MNDFKHVMENNQTRFDQSSGAYSGWRGQSAVDPFQNRAADLWADVADAERWVLSPLADLLVPGLEFVMDAVLPGSGTIAHAVGLDAPLEQGIANLKAGLHKDRVWQSGSQYDLDMSNQISDPRLPAYFKKIQQQNQSLPGSNDFSNLPQNSPAQMIKKANMMQQENETVQINNEGTNLENTMTRFKNALPNSGIDPQQFNAAMQNAQTFQAKQTVLQTFKKQLEDKVLPLVQNNPSLLQQGSDPAVQGGTPVMNQDNSLTFKQGEQTINGDWTPDSHQVHFQG